MPQRQTPGCRGVFRCGIQYARTTRLDLRFIFARATAIKEMEVHPESRHTMGSSHPSRIERLQAGKDGAPDWFLPPGFKTKFDFPRAKEGKRDRLEFTVGERHPGKPRRLDKYLQERFPGYSRSFLQKMIKDERVLINGKSTNSNWHVSASELITMLLYPGGAKVAEDIPFEI